jgi:hypothetical protein
VGDLGVKTGEGYLPAGIYHYDVYAHSLRMRKAGDYRRRCTAPRWSRYGC